MSEDRVASKRFTHLGDILTKVLQTCQRETHQPLLKIDACWQGAFDATLSQNAHPVAMKGTLLMVRVSSPAWIHNLRFQKKQMIETLNRLLGEALVRDIKFII